MFSFRHQNLILPLTVSYLERFGYQVDLFGVVFDKKIRSSYGPLFYIVMDKPIYALSKAFLNVLSANADQHSIFFICKCWSRSLPVLVKTVLSKGVLLFNNDRLFSGNLYFNWSFLDDIEAISRLIKFKNAIFFIEGLSHQIVSDDTLLLSVQVRKNVNSIDNFQQFCCVL